MIRFATTSDLDGIINLETLVWGRPMSNPFDMALSVISGSVCVSQHDSGVLVGYLCYRLTSFGLGRLTMMHPYAGMEMHIWIESLIVHPEYQRQRVATMLLEQVVVHWPVSTMISNTNYSAMAMAAKMGLCFSGLTLLVSKEIMGIWSRYTVVNHSEVVAYLPEGIGYSPNNRTETFTDSKGGK